MSISTQSLYIFSIDRPSKLLPCPIKFIRMLSASSGDTARELALVELANHAGDYPPQYAVIAPRHGHTGFTSEITDTPLFVNIIDGTNFINASSIGLDSPNLPFIDVGGITPSREEAERWHYKSD